jgi:hypothetical protein
VTARHVPAGSWAALLGAAWAGFLLPPQLVEWSGLAAPDWIWRLEGTAAYDWWRVLDGLGGLDAYAWSGVVLAPAWLLMGVPLLRLGSRAGRPAGLVGVVTLLGTVVCAASYLAAEATGPVRLLWGAEAPWLLLLGLTALVAGPVAVARHGMPRWWGGLLAATLLVLAAGTLALTYYPHGALVALGLEVAALVATGGRGGNEEKALWSQGLPSVRGGT